MPTPETTFYQCQKPTPVKAGTQGLNSFREKALQWKGPVRVGFATIAEVPIDDYQVTTGAVHNLENHWSCEHNTYQK